MSSKNNYIIIKYIAIIMYRNISMKMHQHKIACKECGLILNKPKADYTHQFICPRCKACVYKFGQDYETIILMTLTSLILFFPSITLPLITLKIFDLEQTTTLIETVFIFFDNGYIGVSIFITLIGIIIPFIMLLLILFILIPLKNGSSHKKVSGFFKLYEYLLEWQMAEVYLISIFVSIIKLNKMATLHVETGLYFFCAFLVFMFITINFFNPYDIWNKNEV